jgi:HEAT repeat protein
VRHEATEALGLMRAFECKDAIKKILKDPSSGVRNTAILVLKQLDRLEKAQAINRV